jgi:para-nitrobenzyl esterase
VPGHLERRHPRSDPIQLHRDHGPTPGRLGAHHGEELFFLSDTYPSDWQPRRTDRELAKIVRGYWVQFASNADPNSVGAPRWLAYDEGSPRYFEIGERIGTHVVPKRIEALDRIMRQVVTMQGEFR